MMAMAPQHNANGRFSFDNLLSVSQRMAEVLELVIQVADSRSTILILGETGTGKEEVARAIHQVSHCNDGPFVPVNCGALNENLLESELFGHERGAFTGAAGKRKGRFELANGGTLFLDEIGDVPPAMQVRLLRVLQERCFERVGGSEPIAVDVRVIAATHRNLERLVDRGTFRNDLYYRLNVIRIELPPLRERPEDIPVLAIHFCRKFRQPGHQSPEISREAMGILASCPWPGNVRQLENAIERASLTARDGIIRPADLPHDLVPPAGKQVTFNIDLSRPLPDQIAELTAAFEERYIRRALRETRGQVMTCAKLSGLSRRSITAKLAQYKIDRLTFKQNESC
jgi:transcriptional regulator with PAS, ATPase and Fis domain